MKLGFIGLGRMGSNMVENLLDHNHKPVVYNRSPKPTKALEKKGAIPAYTLNELVSKLPSPKIIWLMIPAGSPVDTTIKSLLPLLKRGDIIIDGGNSFFKDSIKRAKNLKKGGIHYLDCGTSGGMEGARKGACMMIGGPIKQFRKTESLFRDMCVKNGYGYMGSSGAGHFVKMVHNGIEYGMMGAIAEGMLANKKHSKKFGLNEKEIAKVYAHGSIISSNLMSWLYNSYKTKEYLEKISCEVPKGETEEEMKKLEKMARMPILNQARKMRVKSRKHQVCGSLIAAMRNQFGGHKVKKRK